MKQTAVEWLVTRIAHGGLVGKKQFDELVEQAKAMEKEQIMDAYKHELDDSLGTKILAEQYYNQTFKSE